ncbi:MAG: glycoside hydrolase family 57 protein [Candidatus Nitrotoga sp.]
MAPAKLLINIYWHMHQPDYRDLITGEYILPWTYLHAIKDYSDMAHHLEANVKARVTFNFVPILLDQLEDYVVQFDTGVIKDPLLQMLGADDLDHVSAEGCELIIDSCFKSHHEKMLSPYVAYQRLYHLYQVASQGADDLSLQYFSAQYKADLLVWYHLAWMGESIKRGNRLVQTLIAKGSHFNAKDRKALFKLVGEIIRNLIPRYKTLQQKGQIEISSTPHHHPILPLLLDFNSTLDAMPNAELPHAQKYSGGEARAVSHVQQAQASHARRFGEKPVGMWPAEGSISKDALLLLAKQGVKWAASGETVLTNSLMKSNPKKALISHHDYLYKPYKISNGTDEIVCFFRDDRLSDKIGFEYSKMHSTDAVNDFIKDLEQVRTSFQMHENPVVSVILDGENAWEYYPYNGHYFLTELYQALSNHPDIEMVTQSEILQAIEDPSKSPYKVFCGNLPEIAAGSWVYGTFSTWIGSKDKNRGWDLLCEAKLAYDQAVQSGVLTIEQIKLCEDQLAVCEGSDWFWWLGDYNSAASISSFDNLYRRNLSNLYVLLKLPVPLNLSLPINVDSTLQESEIAANSGTMKRGKES